MIVSNIRLINLNDVDEEWSHIIIVLGDLFQFIIFIAHILGKLMNQSETQL